MPAQVDTRERQPAKVRQRVRHVPRMAGERAHRAVVVDVGLKVVKRQLRTVQPLSELPQQLAVPTERPVWNRQQMHPSQSDRVVAAVDVDHLSRDASAQVGHQVHGSPGDFVLPELALKRRALAHVADHV